MKILANFISNSIKFTKAGHIGVHIKAVQSDPEGRLLRIAVSDTGIGIDPEKIENIFEPFTQADTSTTREYGGTGLGLSVCRQLAAVMGGTVGANSTPGQGSEFWLDIKLPRSEGYATASEAQSESRKLIGMPKESRANILLAEDNEINQRLTVTILQKAGFDVDVACDGQQAVQMWQAKDYQMILMDWHMPIMDGLHAAHCIREQEAKGHHIPIIALTANAMHGHAEAVYSAGMDDHLPKPFQAKQLLATVTKHLKIT